MKTFKKIAFLILLIGLNTGCSVNMVPYDSTYTVRSVHVHSRSCGHRNEYRKYKNTNLHYYDDRGYYDRDSGRRRYYRRNRSNDPVSKFSRSANRKIHNFITGHKHKKREKKHRHNDRYYDRGRYYR